MKTQDTFHLRAFRAACSHASVRCTIEGVSFSAIKNRRKAVATTIEPDVTALLPDTFTAAAEDLVSLDVQNQELRTSDQAYRITGIRKDGPLVHLDCAQPITLAAP